MIGLAVYLNRKKLTVAGADDLGVLNAIVNAVGKLGQATERIGKRNAPDLFLSVGGLTRRSEGMENEHLRWVRMKRLRVGDKVTIQVVRTERPDKHTNSTVARSGPESRKRIQRLMRDMGTGAKRKKPRR
jgi:intein/homing endonuclease